MSSCTKFVSGTCVFALLQAASPFVLGDAANWSGDNPPDGWSEDAYDPGQTQPGFGNAFTGDPNEPYDSFTDPFHPLKNPNKDPGTQWERQPGSNMGDRSPGAHASKVDWDWGERYFEQKFPVLLNIKNHCSTAQNVSIFTTDLRFLTFPSSVTVPPGGAGLDVQGKVVLPGPPIPTGLPGEPPMGWVDLDPGYIPPGMPPPKLHQPNFVSITGTVVAWHPWAPDSGPKGCLPARTTYSVGGHIHWRPPEPEEEDAGPSRLATTDPCIVYWNTGERPPQARAGQCTTKIRQLARHFIDKVLPSYRSNAPKEWRWLVEFGAVDDKSAQQLVDLKKRASAITGG
ncbi:MAG: hypothetical protein AB8C02_16195 [Halioglobus sp.]